MKTITQQMVSDIMARRANAANGVLETDETCRHCGNVIPAGTHVDVGAWRGIRHYALHCPPKPQPDPESCSHNWRMLSHEERECGRCGEIEFVPDVD